MRMGDTPSPLFVQVFILKDFLCVRVSPVESMRPDEERVWSTEEHGVGMAFL